MEISFFKSISLNHPGGLKDIILKYSSLKRKQLRKIDLALSWKNGRSEHINSQIDLSEIDLGLVHGKPVNLMFFLTSPMTCVTLGLRPNPWTTTASLLCASECLSPL